MSTRIYQGRVTSIKFEDSNVGSEKEAYAALTHTFEMFQDAVNYHLVALASMAVRNDNLLLSSFAEQVKDIWEPDLRESLSRCLGLKYHATFEEIADLIFQECARKDALPYIMQFLLTRGKGEGVISQDSKTITPWLCFKDTTATFPLEIEWLKACKKRHELIQLVGEEVVDEERLCAFVKGMQLTWAGVKCQKGKEWDVDEFREELSAAISAIEVMELPRGIEKTEFEERVQFWKDNIHTIRLTGVMRNAGGNMDMFKKLAALVFLAFPDKVSAKILLTKLDPPTELLPGYPLEDDPFILARGEKGYVYKGVTALPNWEHFTKNWEILAFAEALKTFHGFILKSKERQAESQNIANEIAYIETGKGKKSVSLDDEEEILIPVLGGDPRFEAMKKLVKEISPDEVTEYHISSRTLQGFEQLCKEWLELEAAGKGDFGSLVKKVREYQSSGVRFGSELLYETLCKDEYRLIWHEWTDKKHPRSSNVLRDFAEWQRLRTKKEQYEQPVRVSAANPVTSPRQFRYFDMSKKACKFVSGKQEKMQVCVAVRNAHSRWEFVSAIVEFSAPRFERDEMGRNASFWVKTKNEDAPVSWVQPMMRAMDLSEHLVTLERTPDVALYVKYGKKEEAECPIAYLNLSVSLKVDLLQKEVGKAELWKSQFLGVPNEKLHLHWPGTYKAAGKVEPWWQNESIANNGFSVLGVDLGMRSAFAWSLIHVSKCESDIPSGRLIGSSDNAKWYGSVRKQGITRIDGERIRKVKNKEVPAVALPTKEDLELVKRIYVRVGHEIPQVEHKSLYDLGKSALHEFHLLLRRTRICLSCFAKLFRGEDPEASLEVINKNFSHGELGKDITHACNIKDIGKVKDLLFKKIVELRGILPLVAVDVTNLLLPRKHGHWEWVSKCVVGWQGAGQMLLIEDKEVHKRQVFHRGGISIERIAQLETLRQRLQAMNKVLSCPVGETIPFGRLLKNTKVIDPCPQILEKLENMKEQRVNVIAHEIVAQALGVRLRESDGIKKTQNRDVFHGEYERIPNRCPVDFVVMENLKGYRTNIDRTTEENTALMRWSHHQITAKVVQLLNEVFGIPVLFVHAAYTSKFDCLYSSPGFRPELMTEKTLRYMSQSRDENLVKLATVYQDLYGRLQKSPYRGKIALIKPHYRNGGEMFLSERNGKLTLRNADVNAATNIAWRGIAAPDALHLLHRVRMERKKNGPVLCWKNEREKALKGKWEINQFANVNTESSLISAFFSTPEWYHLSFAKYGDESTSVALTHGKLIWGVLKQRQWELCHRYNMMLLHKAGIDTTPLEKLLLKERKEKDQDSDDIPM